MTTTAIAAKAAPSGIGARVIPFPKARIVRLRRAPRRTAQQQADDDLFDTGFRCALDMMAEMRRKGIVR